MEILAIIPARGGSKGLPGKNIKLLNGHPLIAYSILAAQLCKSITRVIVSTDSDEISAIALQYGAEVPFKRPTEISQDMSNDLEVFQHALSYLKIKENYVPEFVIQLRPTSPIRFESDIESCIERMALNKQVDSLRVVTESPITPYKMWTISDIETPMSPLLTITEIDEAYNEPRQLLPKTYWQVGTLDVIRSNTITEKKSMSGKKILPYVINPEFAIDIDDLNSFTRAEEALNSYDCIKF